MKDERDEKTEKDYKSFSDRELVQMLSNGDRKAFEELYIRYYQGLMRFVMSYCGNRDMAEDIIQEVFLKLMGIGVRLGLVKNIKSYIYSSAINKCRDFVKGERRSVSLNDAVKYETIVSDEEKDYIDIEIMNKFIQKLPDRQREILLLRVGSGLQFKEIASILGVSENSAKVNYFYALSNLRDMMRGDYNG